MTQSDMDLWAAFLADKYGIPYPMAEEDEALSD